MNMRLLKKETIYYHGGKIVVRRFEGGYNSYEALNKNGKTLWLTDILYECDYLETCKQTIDKYG